MSEILWQMADRTVDLSQRALIMGVLNVTPDSFSDGGEFFAPEKANTAFDDCVVACTIRPVPARSTPISSPRPPA